MTKPLIMTVSGIRGIVGETITPEVALKTGMAMGSYVNKGPIIVGGDTRTSYDMLKMAIISGLTAVGTDVIDIGQVPTPTVQQMIKHYQAKGGIIITASHNPIIWNGIKLMNESGSFLTQDQHETVMHNYTNKDLPLKDWSEIGKITTTQDAIEHHVDHILSKIDISSIKNANLKVAIDTNNGTGGLADPYLLDQCGVSYTILNQEANGKFSHTPEPNEKNLEQLSSYMKGKDYDIGFAQDPDADRLVIFDETGRFIGEDYSLAFCIDYVLSQDKTENKKVVVNLSTSNIIEWISQKYQASVIQTKIGETNVTQGLKDHKAVVGGEGNGGVIYPKIGWGRDSLVGIILALKHIAETKSSVSQIVSQYPQYSLVRDKFEVSNQLEVETFIKKVESQFQEYKQNTEDGVKVFLNNSWIHVRPSNTEPIVRIFVEAPSIDEAQKILEDVKQ